MPSPAGRKAAPPGDDDPSGGEVVEKGIELQINTYVGGGYHQDVHVTNHALAETTLVLDWAFAADFADLDEVTSGKRRTGRAGPSRVRKVGARARRTDVRLPASRNQSCDPDTDDRSRRPDR